MTPVHFLLCKIVARIACACLCVICYRRLRIGFAEGQMSWFARRTLLELFLDWPSGGSETVYRDSTPIRYWVSIGSEMITLTCCTFVVIFGWWCPNA